MGGRNRLWETKLLEELQEGREKKPEERELRLAHSWVIKFLFGTLSMLPPRVSTLRTQGDGPCYHEPQLTGEETRAQRGKGDCPNARQG